MLTADEIKAMTDEEACARLAANCTAIYGEQWKTGFARAVDLGVRTVHNWLADRPPVWAIMLTEALAHSREIAMTLKALDSALKSMTDLAKTV